MAELLVLPTASPMKLLITLLQGVIVVIGISNVNEVFIMLITMVLDALILSSVIMVTVLAENIAIDALIVATTVAFDGVVTLESSASLLNTVL